MLNTQQLNGYYTSEGYLFADQVDKNFQEEAKIATAVVLSMINQHQANRQVVDWASERSESTNAPLIQAVTHDALSNPWFWVSMASFRHHPTYFGMHRMHRVSGCCSNTNCDADSCKVFLLVIAIGILVAAFVASVGLTIDQGMKADEARKQLDEIKSLKKNRIQDERVKQIFSKISVVQNKEFANKVLKTAFSATLSVGVGFLTVSAIFALYAVYNGVPYSPYTLLFAKAGGIGAGLSLLGGLTHAATKDRKKIEMLKDLYNNIMDLDTPHPYKLLESTGQENATLVVGDYIYIKKKDHYSKSKFDETTIRPAYPNYVLPEVI
jgi:hypothetical protein